MSVSTPVAMVSQVEVVVLVEVLKLLVTEEMVLELLVLHNLVVTEEKVEEIFMVMQILVDKAEFLMIQMLEVEELEDQEIHLEHKPLQKRMTPDQQEMEEEQELELVDHLQEVEEEALVQQEQTVEL